VTTGIAPNLSMCEIISPQLPKKSFAARLISKLLALSFPSIIDVHHLIKRQNVPQQPWGIHLVTIEVAASRKCPI
jgi:hypothetical protein